MTSSTPITEHATDKALIRQALGGHHAAFARLAERHRDAVTRLALRALNGNRDDAQDVAQEALMYAFQHLPGLRDPSRFGPWLHSATLSLCADFRRRRATRSAAAFPAPCSAPDLAHDPAADMPERLAVRQALANLPDGHRQTVTLFHVGGYSHAEIASLLDIPINTVRSRLQRARRTLLADLTTQFPEKTWMPAETKKKTTTAKDSLPPRYESLVRSAFPDARFLSVERYPEMWMPFHYRVRLGLPNGKERSVDVRAFASLLGYMTGTPQHSHGGTEEAELLETLRCLGLPVPTLLSGPFAEPDSAEATPYALTATPEGENLLLWSLEGNIPHRVDAATRIGITAIDRLHALTEPLMKTPAGARLPRRTLQTDLDEIIAKGGPWLNDPLFTDALRRLRPAVEEIAANTPLVYTNDYYFPNFLRVKDGGITEYIIPWGWFGDPLLGLAKFWTYDCYPFVRTGFVERYLYEKGLTRGDLAPRLAVRALWTLQREAPVERPEEGAAYWDALTGYLRHAMESI
jgi:RNA polymerase sigma-70 factor (ECF subfamily)